MPQKPRYEQLVQRVRELERAESEREAATDALRKSEERFRRLFKNTPLSYQSLDEDGCFIEVNRAWLDTLGYAEKEVIGKSFADFLHPDWRDHFRENFPRFKAIGEILGIEFEMVKKDGDLILVSFNGKIGTDQNGVFQQTHCIFQDITESKQALASLKSIEWLLQRKVTTPPSPSQPYGDLTRLNTEGTILGNIGRDVLSDIVGGYLELLETSSAIYERNGDYAHGIFSSGWCRMLDAASRQLCDTGDDAKALVCGKWLCHESCWTDAASASIQSGKPVDVPCHGGLRIYAVPIHANGEVVGSIDFGYGDPPQSEEALLDISKKYGLDPASLLEQARQYETRPPFIIEIAKRRLQSSAKLIGALVEGRLAQHALEKEREKLKVTLGSIGDGVITTDTESRVALMNKVAEKLTGWTQQQAKGKKIETVFHIVDAQTRKRCINPVKRVLEKSSIMGLPIDTVLVARDGTEYVVAETGSPIAGSDGNIVGVVLVFRDISEKIEMEARLRQAHKMEAVGNLAGGIAHEFNNILGIIIGNAELADDDLEAWHPAGSYVREIKKAGLRAADVVKQLLSFSRKAEVRRKPIDIGIIATEAINLLKASIPSDVRIQKFLAQDIEAVVADPTQVQQLLINLGNNAAQAMAENGGRLTFELSNFRVDPDGAPGPAHLQPGTYVRISVRDNGNGIPPEYLDKIFDPYFTTKDVSQGTGMGLAVAHGIVQAHDGAIVVDSILGKGTVFHVYLPSSREIVDPPAADVQALPTGSEKIMLVDDEPAIAKLGERLLRKLGYMVVSETDADQALKRFRSDPTAYDLVITDMTMPQMSGDRLAEALIKLRKKIPIIVCTGYSEKMSLEKAQQMGIRALLMKPMVKADLAKTVRSVLDEAPSDSPAESC